MSIDIAPGDELLTYQQAADDLGTKVEAIYGAVASRRLTVVKLPGVKHKFIRRSDLETYKASRYASMRKQPEGERAASATADSAARVSYQERAHAVLEGLRIIAPVFQSAFQSLGESGSTSSPKMRAS